MWNKLNTSLIFYMINIYQNLTVTDLHDWAVIQTFLKIDFSLVMPHLEYDVHKCSPNLVVNINNTEHILATRLETSLLRTAAVADRPILHETASTNSSWLDSQLQDILRPNGCELMVYLLSPLKQITARSQSLFFKFHSNFISGNLNISKSKTTYTAQTIIKLTETGLSICYQRKKMHNQ